VDNKEEETSVEVSKDMTRVESICKEMGFVTRANQGSRCVIIVLTCC